MIFRVVPIGGLGNRLRTIMSCRAAEGPIEVVWCRSDAVCRGRWEDAFTPLDGVTFVDGGEGHAHDYADQSIVCWEQIHKRAPEGWTRGYAELRPATHVLARQIEIFSTMGAHLGAPPYRAIHARRCDHVAHSALFGHTTSNDELLAWYGNYGPLYVATDGSGDAEWFAQRVIDCRANRLHEHVSGYEKRPGTLADAAVDLFMCARASRFRGSWMSSFSETIDLLRCGGDPPGGFYAREHMPSADAEWYRGRPDRARERIARSK